MSENLRPKFYVRNFTFRKFWQLMYIINIDVFTDSLAVTSIEIPVEQFLHHQIGLYSS